MKNSELRIGNWLNWYSKYHCNGYFDKQLEIEDFTQTDLSSARPIPLTEEWLLKFGFTWRGLISKGRYLTIFTPCGKALVHNDNFFIFTGVTIETPIQYVHQLQNLYFALTGKELKIES